MNGNRSSSRSSSAEVWSGVTGGLVLIAVGAVFLLSKLELVEGRAIWRYLPWIVMLVLGGVRLLAPGWQRVRSGLTMGLIGTWGLASTLGWAGFTWGSSWPLLLIGFGALILLDGDPRRFVRIHCGYLLNLDRLARLESYAKDSRIAFLRDGRRLPEPGGIRATEGAALGG